MNKTALVTGASMGIGKALAQKMLEEGYTVIGTNRSGNIAGLNNPKFHAIPLDLTKPDNIKDATNRIKAIISQIDILINNAGVGPDLNASKPQEDSYATTFKINVEGTVFFTEEMLDLIPFNGKIINVSSKMGSIAMCSGTDSTAYCMSKSALNMYTKILSNRLANKIKVATIHPGWVQTTISPDSMAMAPLTPQQSAENMYRFISQDFETGTFWDSATDSKLPW